jgi:hypothetical protein
MTIKLLPGKDCAVVAEEVHTAGKVQQQRNDQARDYIETSVSMEMVSSWCQHIHTRCKRHAIIIGDSTPGTSLQEL